jgi:hypothetical protein
MAHAAHAAPRPLPRANPVLARGCEMCLGWGTVITDEGQHELCPACQTDAREAGPIADAPPTHGHA